MLLAGMSAGVPDFNVINLGDLEVKFAEGDEVSLETLQVQQCLCLLCCLSGQIALRICGVPFAVVRLPSRHRLALVMSVRLVRRM